MIFIVKYAINLKILRILKMFQKFAPLIILALFVVGMYFMMQGMDKAVHHTKVKRVIPKN